MEFQEYIFRNREKIAGILLTGVALFGGTVVINHLAASPEQSISNAAPDIQDTHNNSVIVQKSSGTYIYSCDNYNLVEDKFGPITAAGSNVEVIKGAPACANEWLTAADVPLIK